MHFIKENNVQLHNSLSLNNFILKQKKNQNILFYVYVYVYKFI